MNGGEEYHICDIGRKVRRKETIGRPTRRWLDDIRKDFGELG
jgi:hypothetical protein